MLDAYCLADLLRRQVVDERGELGLALVGQAERPPDIDQERFVAEHRRLQYQLHEALETYYPAMTHLFSSIDRSITLAFLRRYPVPVLHLVHHLGLPRGAPRWRRWYDMRGLP